MYAKFGCSMSVVCNPCFGGLREKLEEAQLFLIHCDPQRPKPEEQPNLERVVAQQPLAMSAARSFYINQIQPFTAKNLPQASGSLSALSSMRLWDLENERAGTKPGRHLRAVEPDWSFTAT